MQSLNIKKQQILGWLLITYLSKDALRVAVRIVFSRLGLSWLVEPFVLLVILAPLLLLWIGYRTELWNAIPYFVLLGLLAFLFFLTLVIYPEYQEYFFGRGYLSVPDAVFDLYSGGLICFLVFLLQEDPEKVLRDMYVAAWFILLYGIYASIKAEGEWQAYDAAGKLVTQNYGLNFGYQMMFGAIIFLYTFFRKRRWFDLLAFIAVFFIVITNASRGANLCLAVFLVLYFLKSIRKKPLYLKLLLFFLLVLVYIATAFYWNAIITAFSSFLAKMNFRSRTIELMLLKSITFDSGRSDIYRLSWEAIKHQGLFGYGIFGDRSIIAPYYYWGYPHNFFLEVIMQFGWPIGGVLLILLIRRIVKLFRETDRETWGLLCILTSMCIKLFLSDSFWQYPFFWGLLGCMFTYQRRKKREQMNGLKDIKSPKRGKATIHGLAKVE